MGKSDEQQTKKRAHKATDGESKHKNKPSFDATIFEATNDEGYRQSHWGDHFRQLCEFKVQFGHCLVPNRYSANGKLGKWVSRQRSRYRDYREEKSTSVTAEHIRALDGIGFDWGTSKSALASICWSARFQQLRKFKMQFGHCSVPHKYTANPGLGQWVTNQRRNYKLCKEGKPSPLMTEERIRELESVGFVWEPTVCVPWSVRFQQLCEYKVQFGHCAVPQKYSTNPKLGQWVKSQRKNIKLYQEGKPSPMTEERIRELQSVAFDREPTGGALWSVQFEQLCEHKVQFGHCAVPHNYSANNKLGKWVSNQRSNYKLCQEGKPSPMTEERILVLDDIGFKWEAR